MWMFQWVFSFGHVKKYGVASSMDGLLNKSYQVFSSENEILTLSLLHL